MFDSESEVVAWVEQQRLRRPWLTETGLISEAYALGYAAAQGMGAEVSPPVRPLRQLSQPPDWRNPAQLAHADAPDIPPCED